MIQDELEESHVSMPAALAALPLAASAVAVIIGGMVLLGWFADVELLKRGLPGFVAMNPTTAITFILCGTCLVLFRNPERAGRVSALARCLAGVVVLVGVIKLVGLIMGWPSNVDELLVTSKLSPAGEIPNRMAPNTASNFIFIGSGLLLLDLPAKRFSPSQALSLLAAFGALISITGYVYGVRSFYGIASFIPMAPHTALTFLILAAGVFFARTETPLSQLFATREPRGVLARRLFPTAIIVTLILGWLRLHFEQVGVYDAQFGTALYSVTLCAIFVILISWAVWTVGRAEERQAAAHREVLKSNSQLQESLQQIELMINHARELICTLDQNGCLLTMSAASLEVLGYGARDMVGKAFCEIHSSEDGAKLDRALRDAKAGLTVANFEAKCRRRDSSFTPIAWSLQAAVHHRRIFCVGRDIGNQDADYGPWQRT